MSAIHEEMEVDWIDSILATAFTFLAIMSLELPSRIGFSFTQDLFAVEGVTFTVATAGSIVVLLGAFLTNGIDSDWTAWEWGLLAVGALMILGFVAMPAVTSLLMSSLPAAIVYLLVMGIVFAMVAYY
jgi:hypothetical protein